MNPLPATDVDRVLDRMGRPAFAYHRFPPPLEPADPPTPFAAMPEAPPAPPAAVFPLIAAALPAAAKPGILPAAAASVPPAAHRPPPAPFAAEAPPRALDTTLSDLFRLLSGAIDRPPARTESRDPLPTFPFQRG